MSVPALQTTGAPLQLPQVSVVHLQAKVAWNGAAIGEAVAAISRKAGQVPTYLISAAINLLPIRSLEGDMPYKN